MLIANQPNFTFYNFTILKNYKNYFDVKFLLELLTDVIRGVQNHLQLCIAHDLKWMFNGLWYGSYTQRSSLCITNIYFCLPVKHTLCWHRKTNKIVLNFYFFKNIVYLHHHDCLFENFTKNVHFSSKAYKVYPKVDDCLFVFNIHKKKSKYFFLSHAIFMRSW